MVSAPSRAGGGAGGPQTAPHPSKLAEDTPASVPFNDFVAEVSHVMNKRKEKRDKDDMENPAPKKRPRLK